MINFIITLEDALNMIGVDWEIKYLPDVDARVLRINDKEVFLLEKAEETEND